MTINRTFWPEQINRAITAELIVSIPILVGPGDRRQGQGWRQGNDDWGEKRGWETKVKRDLTNQQNISENWIDLWQFFYPLSCNDNRKSCVLEGGYWMVFISFFPEIGLLLPSEDHLQLASLRFTNNSNCKSWKKSYLNQDKEGEAEIWDLFCCISIALSTFL